VGEELDAGSAAELGLVGFTPDDIDWDEEVRWHSRTRVIFTDALTGMEASLRSPGPEDTGDQDFRASVGLAELDISTANAAGENGALKLYGSGKRAVFDRGEYNELRLFRTNPNNVNLAENRRLQRALEEWQPRFLNWWRELGRSVFKSSMCICARPPRSMRRDGRPSIMSECGLPVGIFLAETDPEPIDLLRCTSGTAGLAGFPVNIAGCCAA